MKMLVLLVVTEFYQDGVLTDFKAALARSDFPPSDYNHSAVGVSVDANCVGVTMM